MIDFEAITSLSEYYNLHTHTQFCDGHAPMSEMAAAAAALHYTTLGFTPHGPVHIESPCNMSRDYIPAYYAECDRLRQLYAGRMEILRGMEIDYLDPRHGPSSQYYADLGLDYSIGSVHFVANRKGEQWDCDGSPERFGRYVREHFCGDLRYVVEKYFAAVCDMLTRGGFHLLGHFDKIGRNADAVEPGVEDCEYYLRGVEDVLACIHDTGVAVELNTKYLKDTGRLFPNVRWLPMVMETGATLVVNSDAHYPDKLDNGRPEALKLIE